MRGDKGVRSARCAEVAPHVLGGQLRPRAQAGLGEDVVEVRLHRRPTHEEALGDLRVGEAVGNEGGDLLFGRSQRGPAVARSLSRAAGAGGVRGRVGPRQIRTLGRRGARRFGAERLCRGRDREVEALLLGAEPPAVPGLVA